MYEKTRKDRVKNLISEIVGVSSVLKCSDFGDIDMVGKSEEGVGCSCGE